MKKLLIIFLGLALTASSVNAQELPTKLGHINAQEILQAMPERAKAEKEITDLRTNLESTLQELSKEYEGKVGQFQQMDPSTTVATQEKLSGECRTRIGSKARSAVTADVEEGTRCHRCCWKRKWVYLYL